MKYHEQSWIFENYSKDPTCHNNSLYKFIVILTLWYLHYILPGYSQLLTSFNTGATFVLASQHQLLNRGYVVYMFP